MLPIILNKLEEIYNKMSRKRSVASLLADFDDEELSSSRPSRRDRTISSIINEELPVRQSQKVVCNCSECNSKLVDLRTKEIHESRYQEYHQGSQGTISAEIEQLEIGETSTAK